MTTIISKEIVDKINETLDVELNLLFNRLADSIIDAHEQAGGQVPTKEKALDIAKSLFYSWE